MSNDKPITTSRLTAYKGHVTIAFHSCESELTADQPSIQNLEFKCSKLETAFKRYSEAFYQFEDLQDATGDEYNAAYHSYQETENTYLKEVTKINNLIASLRPAASVPKQPQSSSKPKLKLPAIELPTFSGNRRDWPPFWESFNALVHNNPELEDVAKFTYLKQSLKGEAAN